jgi:hypothetical protein
VTTTNLTAGWLRKNGVPYSENATVTEYFDRFKAPNNDEWLVVTTIVSDPKYLNQDFVTSTHFKKERTARSGAEPCKPLEAWGRLQRGASASMKRDHFSTLRHRGRGRILRPSLLSPEHARGGPRTSSRRRAAACAGSSSRAATRSRHPVRGVNGRCQPVPAAADAAAVDRRARRQRPRPARAAARQPARAEWFVYDRSEPQSEDCLVLERLHAVAHRRPQAPVMVWLHGGGFVGGSSGFTCTKGRTWCRCAKSCSCT